MPGKNRTCVPARIISLSFRCSAEHFSWILQLEDPPDLKRFSFVLGPLERRLGPDAVMWPRRRRLARSLSFNILLDNERTLRYGAVAAFGYIPASSRRLLQGAAFHFSSSVLPSRAVFLFQVYCSSLQRSRTWPTARVEEMKYLWVYLFVAIEILKFFPVAAATKHDGHVLPFVFHPASIKTYRGFSSCSAASGYTEFFLLSFCIVIFR